MNWRNIYLSIALIGIGLYLNTLGHDYTVDDTTVIKNNRFTTQGLAGIDEIFSSSYRAGYWDRKEGLYRPLSVAMFAVEWAIAPDNPFPGHLINVLLYGLTAIVVLSLMRTLFCDSHPFIPLFITLLWLVHPLHTEVVANIKSRDEILSFLFGSIALFHFMRNKGQPTLFQNALACTSFALALLSKENSITWLGVLPLARWCFTQQSIRQVALAVVPFLLLTLAYFVLRISILGEVSGGYELMLINNSIIGADSLSGKFATAMMILGKYLMLFVTPVNLVFDYSYNTLPIVGLGHPGALLSLVIVIAGFVFALLRLPQRSGYAFSILFFLGTVALVSNVFFLIEATMAERFVFTPSLGLCMLVGIAASSVSKAKVPAILTFGDIKKHPLFWPGCIVLLLFSTRTISRNADWKDNLTLLNHDVELSPNSARIRYALGSTLLVEKALKAPEGSTERNNLLDRAITELNEGVKILPNYNDAWYNLGIAWKERGNAANAVVAFEQARSYKPFTDASRFLSAGVAYGENKQYDKALKDLTEATRLEPDNADAWNNYGLYLSEAGQQDASHTALNKSIALKPDFFKAYYNKGNTFAKQNNFRAALQQYQEALRWKTDFTDALNNSGNCHIMLQQFDSAMLFFRRAAEADPGNVKALMNLSYTLQQSGDTVQARMYFERAKALGAR
jgi:tetratricopeptide (TPR) repeat protein